MSGPLGQLAAVDPLGQLGQLGTGPLGGDLNADSGMHPCVPFSLRIRSVFVCVRVCSCVFVCVRVCSCLCKTKSLL